MTREEAIQILSTRDAHGVLCGYTSGVTEALDMAIEALSAEAVQGEWKDAYRKTANFVEFSVLACSECNYADPQMNYYNYCPNCGADMRGGKE